MLTDAKVISEKEILEKLSTIGYSPGTSSYEKVCLNLSASSISDLSAVSRFTALQSIDISSNLIASLHALTPLDQLRYLNASHNHLTEFPEFVKGIDEDQFPRLLTEVNVSFNRITIIRNDIDRLRYIADLNFKANALQSLQWCRSLVNLQKLDVSDNEISNLEGLEGAVLLTDLNISKNSITSLQLTSALPYLRYIQACNNMIENIDQISVRLPNLAVLDLADNRITSLIALADLPQLQLLRDLNLKGNGIVHLDQYRNELVFLLPDLEYLDRDRLTTLEILQSEISHGKHEDIFPSHLAKQCEIIATEGTS